MLGAATVSLARAGEGGFVDVAIAVVTFVLLARVKVSPLWPLLGAGVLRLGLVFFGRG